MPSPSELEAVRKHAALIAAHGEYFHVQEVVECFSSDDEDAGEEAFDLTQEDEDGEPGDEEQEEEEGFDDEEEFEGQYGGEYLMDDTQDYAEDSEDTLRENDHGINIEALIEGISTLDDDELSRELYCEGEGMHIIRGTSANKKKERDRIRARLKDVYTALYDITYPDWQEASAGYDERREMWPEARDCHTQILVEQAARKKRAQAAIRKQQKERELENARVLLEQEEGLSLSRGAGGHTMLVGEGRSSARGRRARDSDAAVEVTPAGHGRGRGRASERKAATSSSAKRSRAAPKPSAKKVAKKAAGANAATEASARKGVYCAECGHKNTMKALKCAAAGCEAAMPATGRKRPARGESGEGAEELGKELAAAETAETEAVARRMVAKAHVDAAAEGTGGASELDGSDHVEEEEDEEDEDATAAAGAAGATAGLQSKRGSAIR